MFHVFRTSSSSIMTQMLIGLEVLAFCTTFFIRFHSVTDDNLRVTDKPDSLFLFVTTSSNLNSLDLNLKAFKKINRIQYKHKISVHRTHQILITGLPFSKRLIIHPNHNSSNNSNNSNIDYQLGKETFNKFHKDNQSSDHHHNNKESILEFGRQLFQINSL